MTNAQEGLSSAESFRVFLDEFETATNKFGRKQNENNLRSCSGSSPYPLSLLVTTILSSITLLVGAVDIDNEIAPSLVVASVLLLVFTLLICLVKITRRRSKMTTSLARVYALLKQLKKNDFSSVSYETIREPVSEDMSTQLGIRDGKIVSIPRLLLVKGDTILLRPGQTAPCLCVDENGIRYEKGQKPLRLIEKDEESETAIPLNPLKCTLLESEISSHLQTILSAPVPQSSLSVQLHILLEHYLTRIILPLALLTTVLFATIRFYYADEGSLFGTRFIFAVPATILLPLLCPIFPLLIMLIAKWNNAAVFSYINAFSFENRGMFYLVAKRCSVFRMFLRSLIGDTDVCSKDLVAVLGNLTGVSFVDKKGLLSSPVPQLDKIFFMRPSDRDAEKDVEPPLQPETLDLSTEMVDGAWRVDFDDPNWHRFETSLTPIAQNVLLNSCRFKDKYNQLLDHVTCVSEFVPRTIATANRRCTCQLPEIVGFGSSAGAQFDPAAVPTLGLYKRLPGDAPLPGLTKHRTPLETAFCTVHTDDRSLHLHLSCQGTAGIVLDACTHIWDGVKLRPLQRSHRKQLLDFYQRHSMTGYCLALSYRPVGAAISAELSNKFIEVPLQSKSPGVAKLPRSHSFDSMMQEEFFTEQPLKRSQEIIDAYFQGHVFCGMVALQYQAHPSVVHLVDALESDCIRFVYFSRENELRSRIFAEKLGLEAGWNCHVCLAEEDEEVGRKRNKDAFLPANNVSQQGKRRTGKSLGHSDLSLSLDWERCVVGRGSPSSRSISRASGASSNQKVGPMPNKARLPAGVQNVRPHLENVDNVPLLVGLFTDSAPSTNCEMLNIMQEYGEVVMVVSSSLNVHNKDAVVQADVSVCVDPIRGGCCNEKDSTEETPGLINGKEAYPSTYETRLLLEESPKATAIAASCMALAADLHLKHEQLAVLPDLISACRHRLFSLRSSLLFLLYSSAALSLLVFFSTILFLPILFKPDQIILFCLFILPLLSASIISGSFQPSKTFIRISGKNLDHINRKEIRSSVATFCVQFLPTVLFILFLYYALLVQHSNLVCSFSDVMCTVSNSALHVYSPSNLSEFAPADVDVQTSTISSDDTPLFLEVVADEDDLPTEHIRHVMGFHTVLYTIVLSACWVHSLNPIWKSPPICNVAWMLAALMCICSQIIFTRLTIGLWIWSLLRLQSVFVLSIWSCIALAINEIRKQQNIRLFSREQRRRKLAFDTKLGMNSPY